MVCRILFLRRTRPSYLLDSARANSLQVFLTFKMIFRKIFSLNLYRYYKSRMILK